MKDAAVLADLGSVGKNSLVVTPKYGPCDGCDEPCRKVCPVGAFDESANDASVLGQSQLPGTDGTYDRITYNTRMAQDV